MRLTVVLAPLGLRPTAERYPGVTSRTRARVEPQEGRLFRTNLSGRGPARRELCGGTGQRAAPGVSRRRRMSHWAGAP